MKLYKRVVAGVLALIASAAITIPAFAGSHTATKCTGYQAAKYAECTKGRYSRLTNSSKPSWYTYDAVDWGNFRDHTCEWCEEKTATGAAFLSCSSCSYYNTSCDEGKENKSSYWWYTCSSCISEVNAGLNKPDETGWGDGTHDKAKLVDGSLEYTISTPAKSCTTHTAYANKTHYYCNTHNYVGTSKTCTYADVAVSPTPKTMSITVGQSSAITPNATSGSTVTYSSNKTAVATVSNTGAVTGVSKGSATITVKAVL